MDILYAKIENLHNDKDKVKSIQEILYQMAYYISQTETVILDRNEEWRQESTKKMKKDTKTEKQR